MTSGRLTQPSLPVAGRETRTASTSISPAIQAQSARGPHQDTALRKEILLHL
jgi:hypothetical protein